MSDEYKHIDAVCMIKGMSGSLCPVGRLTCWGSGSGVIYKCCTAEDQMIQLRVIADSVVVPWKGCEYWGGTPEMAEAIAVYECIENL